MRANLKRVLYQVDFRFWGGQAIQLVWGLMSLETGLDRYVYGQDIGLAPKSRSVK